MSFKPPQRSTGPIPHHNSLSTGPSTSVVEINSESDSAASVCVQKQPLPGDLDSGCSDATKKKTEREQIKRSFQCLQDDMDGKHQNMVGFNQLDGSEESDDHQLDESDKPSAPSAPSEPQNWITRWISLQRAENEAYISKLNNPVAHNADTDSDDEPFPAAARKFVECVALQDDDYLICNFCGAPRLRTIILRHLKWCEQWYKDQAESAARKQQLAMAQEAVCNEQTMAEFAALVKMSRRGYGGKRPPGSSAAAAAEKEEQEQEVQKTGRGRGRGRGRGGGRPRGRGRARAGAANSRGGGTQALAKTEDGGVQKKGHGRGRGRGGRPRVRA